MLDRIGHISLTVTNLKTSIDFYVNTLGMKLAKEMVMDCKSTEVLFGIRTCKVKVAHLKGCEDCGSPAIELLQFAKADTLKDDIRLNRVAISGISFYVDDIDKHYKELKEKGVEFISEPQYFDSTDAGFGKNKAAYFTDPDGIILELLEEVEKGTPVNEMDISTCLSPSNSAVTGV